MWCLLGFVCFPLRFHIFISRFTESIFFWNLLTYKDDLQIKVELGSFSLTSTSILITFLSKLMVSSSLELLTVRSTLGSPFFLISPHPDFHQHNCCGHYAGSTRFLFRNKGFISVADGNGAGRCPSGQLPLGITLFEKKPRPRSNLLPHIAHFQWPINTAA